MNYDPAYCDESNCDPYSVNWDWNYCKSLCDPTSVDFNETSCNRIVKTWDVTTDTRILSLADCLKARGERFINRCQSELGITVRVTEGFRSIEQQNLDYAKGRTQAELDAVGLTDVTAQPNETKVTNAYGGQSYHNYGAAFDCVEISGGQALYTNTNWSEIGRIGKEEGFDWGGDWTSPVDKPHFQYTNGHTIDELQNGTDLCE